MSKTKKEILDQIIEALGKGQNTLAQSLAAQYLITPEEWSIGISFSSPDETKGNTFQEQAIELVREWYIEHLIRITAATIYVVQFSYILGNWKALVSTSLPDGRYFELTHNSEKNETYVDVYTKQENYAVPSNK